MDLGFPEIAALAVVLVLLVMSAGVIFRAWGTLYGSPDAEPMLELELAEPTIEIPAAITAPVAAVIERPDPTKKTLVEKTRELRKSREACVRLRGINSVQDIELSRLKGENARLTESARVVKVSPGEYAAAADRAVQMAESRASMADEAAGKTSARLKEVFSELSQVAVAYRELQTEAAGLRNTAAEAEARVRLIEDAVGDGGVKRANELRTERQRLKTIQRNRRN